MSQAALFGFGAIIFFIVITGALLYGMASIKAFADRTQ
jgi:Ni,Fe-hydrogenase I cytochrome b subunit